MIGSLATASSDSLTGIILPTNAANWTLDGHADMTNHGWPVFQTPEPGKVHVYNIGTRVGWDTHWFPPPIQQMHVQQHFYPPASFKWQLLFDTQQQL